LAHTCKKDLTKLALALILAQGTLWKIVVVLLLARPRQNSRKISSLAQFAKKFFRKILLFSGKSIFLLFSANSLFHVEHSAKCK
jgi:hypothetical protein